MRRHVHVTSAPLLCFALIIIIMASFVALHIQYFPAWYVGLCLNYETYSFYIAPCNGLLGPLAQYAANHVVGIYKKNNVPEFPT